jgi:type I restriction enzyme S subunit
MISIEAISTTPPSLWVVVRLNEVCEVRYGKALASEIRENSGSVPVIGSSLVSAFHDTAYHHKPSIVIGRKGSVGSIQYVDVPFWPIDTVFFLDQVSPLIDLSYLAAALSHFGLDRYKIVVGVPGINRKDLESFLFPLPPLSEQQQIVEILQEAEQLRRLRSQAESKTADLIPAMFESHFGDPVGNSKEWHIEPLASVINGTPQNGLYKPAELYGEGTPIIRIGDFTGGILRTSKNLQRLRITAKEIEQFGVSNGQILINRVNSIEHLGKSLLVASLTEPTVYESNMMRLDPKREKVLPGFLIACLQHPSLVAKLRAKAKKAINQASINQTDVLTLNIPVPPLPAQEAFVEEVEQAEAIRLLGETSLSLEKSLNSSLSSHAFSGELTAEWREANADKLEAEARERDQALQASQGRAVHLSAHAIATSKATASLILEVPTDGIYSDLNREQRFLFNEINRMVGGVRYIRYFNAKMVGDYVITPPLRKNPQAIEGHLAVLAVRGLLIPVSREEQTEDTGEYLFGNAYRLALKDQPNVIQFDGEALTLDGELITMGSEPGDLTRLREMERIIGQFEKERTEK